MLGVNVYLANLFTSIEANPLYFVTVITISDHRVLGRLVSAHLTRSIPAMTAIGSVTVTQKVNLMNIPLGELPPPPTLSLNSSYDAPQSARVLLLVVLDVPAVQC